MTPEKMKKDLLDKIDSLERKVIYPKDYKSIKEKMSSLSYDYIDKTIEEAPAACTRTDGSYYIIISKQLKDYAYVPLDLHESGHILFQHLRNQDLKLDQVKSQLKGKWSYIKNCIDNNAEFTESKMFDYFSRYLLNVAEDMEINSKFFGVGDNWKKQKDNISIGVLRFTIENIENISKKQYDSFKKLIKSEECFDFCAGIHPDSYKYPPALNYMSYINLILMNPSDFLKSLEKELEKQQYIENKIKEILENEVILEDESKSSFSDSVKIKISIISKNVEKQKSKDKAAAEVAEEDGSKNKGDDFYKILNKQIGNGSVSKIIVNEEKVIIPKDVKDFIAKNCFSKSNVTEKQDFLYKYNRGKTNVLTNKTKVMEVYRPGNLIALVDVSGSVDTRLISSIIKEINNFKKFLGKNSRIILWNVECIDDMLLNKFNGDIKAGGGTDISSGIEYAKNYLKTSLDKLFIISDFEDDLSKWVKSLYNIKSEVFAIKWGGSLSMYKGDGKDDLLKYCKNPSQVKCINRIKVKNVEFQ